MPASQVAKPTPGNGGTSGSRAGANGEGFVSDLAMSGSPAVIGRSLLLLAVAGALAVDHLLDLGVDIFDLGLAAQSQKDLLGLVVDHGGAHAVLDGLEGRHLVVAAAIDLDDVPAELGFERLGDLARLQLERGLLELRHHLPAAEVAERAALLLGARIDRILFGERGKVRAVRDLLEQFPGLILAGNKDV